MNQASPAAASSGVPLGVITVDTGLVIRTWSAWVEAASGIPAGEAQGRPLGEVLPDIAARGLLEHFQGVAATGEAHLLAPAFHKYLISCPPHSESVHFDRMQQLVTLGALREGDRIVGVMATIEDVTERLDAERALAEGLRSGDASVREQAVARLETLEALHQPGAFVDVLKTSGWQARRSTVQGLARHASRDLLGSLIEALRREHRDFNVLGSALQLLSMIDVDVTPPLAALLRDPSPDLRMQAALALGDHPGAGSAAALLTALSDDDMNVRFHAIESLGRLKCNDAVEALSAIAESGDFFLAFPAVDALARIADPRVVPRLVPLLSDEELTGAVAEALGRLAGGEVVPALVAVLNRPHPPVAAIAAAIAGLYGQYKERYGGGDYIVTEFQQALTAAGSQRILDAVADAGRDELRPLVLLLGWLEGPAVGRALTQLLGRPDLRGEVIEALVRQGAQVVAVLLDQLFTADQDVRLAAIAALGRLGDPRATPALASLLGDDRATTIAAAGALAHIGDPSAFDRLFALLTDEDASVRQAVIGALNSLGHPEMGRPVRGLLSGSDPRGRESAVRIAGYFGYADCAPGIVACCDDPDESVRRAALEQLPFVLEDEAIPLLTRALARDAPRVRASAAMALGKIAGAESRAALDTALSDSDAWVRYFATRSLAQQRDESALDQLAGLAGHDPAAHVRIAALEAIGAIDGPRAASVLASHADDEDDGIAGAAIAALGELKDVAAIPSLLQALRSPDPTRRLVAINALAQGDQAERVTALRWTAAGDAQEVVAEAAFDGLGRVAARASGAWGEAVDALLELSGTPGRRERAVAALARVPESHVDRVAAGLSHAVQEVRRAAVEALMRIKAPAASARVREALNDADAAVREAAVTALDRVGTPGLGATFALMAANDAAVEVRRAAAAAMQHRTGLRRSAGDR